MNPHKGCVNIACSDSGVAQALSRYLKYCFGFEDIVFNPLSNPFRFTDALNLAEGCDLLIVDAIMDETPKGFQLAKQIGTKTLLLFYSGEIEINDEGPFWLALPNKLKQLQFKIIDLMMKPKITYRKYKELEKKHPLLKEFKNHHF